MWQEGYIVFLTQILRNRGDKMQDDRKQAKEVRAKRTAKNSVFFRPFPR